MYSAKLTEPADFLRLVWESGTVTGGGYLLHCLPEPTAARRSRSPTRSFPDQRTGSLVLLIEGAAANAHSFHNCVIVRDTAVDLSEAPLMAQCTADPAALTLASSSDTARGLRPPSLFPGRVSAEYPGPHGRADRGFRARSDDFALVRLRVDGGRIVDAMRPARRRPARSVAARGRGGRR